MLPPGQNRAEVDWVYQFWSFVDCSCVGFCPNLALWVAMRTSCSETTLGFILWGFMVEDVVLSITLCFLYAGLGKNSDQICGPAETSSGWLVVSVYLVGTVSSTIWYFCLWFG